jgi:hypothetical protein
MAAPSTAASGAATASPHASVAPSPASFGQPTPAPVVPDSSLFAQAASDEDDKWAVSNDPRVSRAEPHAMHHVCVQIMMEIERDYAVRSSAQRLRFDLFRTLSLLGPSQTSEVAY